MHPRWLHLAYAGIRSTTENYRDHKSVHTTRQEEEPHKEAWSSAVTSTLDLLSESQGKKVVQLEGRKPCPDDVTGGRESLRQMYRKPFPRLSKLF